ncbi:glycosyltransferase involved in cell wall biosynthesis [Novosphingobium sp. PhB165]|uniref:glycosyltransferase family 4 protein n=1 Tax=Novosphingobium sp. PhB165 TaxID=2485105 RepID=UPI0010435106|nr:glycosyltransferase family 4 protein [Novosphingobium sp. PhB165]TCM20530.1 glycosyltransferase involved in cell wall biosynthesis [Novosphingobium sp. PhB165]
MKVCVTGLRGIPGVIGGVETHCEELLPRIAQINPDIEIEVCCRARYVDPELVSFRRLKLMALYAPRTNASEALVSTLMGVIHAWREGADAVHIHAVGPALLAPIARLLGMSVLLTHHGADYNRGKWGLFARSMLRLGEWVGMHFADRVICVSPSLAATMRDRYPGAAGKVVFIPNGVNPPEPSSAPAEEVLGSLGCAPGNFVLCVARLVPEKGLDYLIDAFRMSGDNRILVIAGAGRKGDRHAEQLMARADDKVRMLGMQPRSVLGVLYRHASLFVLPSFHEGLPIAALEALACECPVLLSDIQPNLDIGLPEDCYFPVGDVDALSARLAAGGEVPDEAAPFHLSLIDWDEVAIRTTPYYRELVKRAKLAPELHNAG